MYVSNMHHQAILTQGYTIVEAIYTAAEIAAILQEINKASTDKTLFEKRMTYLPSGNF